MTNPTESCFQSSYLQPRPRQYYTWEVSRMNYSYVIYDLALSAELERMMKYPTKAFCRPGNERSPGTGAVVHFKPQPSGL